LKETLKNQNNMETFDDFKKTSGPEMSAGAIISDAFETYKGTFLYGLLMMVIMFGASLIVTPLVGFDSQGLMEEMRSSPETFTQDMWMYPGFTTYYGISGLISLLLTPLYIGFIYIANKYNHGEQISAGDLFIGYRQNFLNIVLFGLLFSIIIGIAAALCVVPLFFVLPLLFLGFPILLFENASATEALSKSFQIAKNNYGAMLLASFLGFLISIAGVFLCGIGLILTMPFMIVVMYSAYCAAKGRPRTIITE